MSIYNLLRDEIHREVESLSKTDVGSDGYKTTVDGVAKLVDKVIEMEKIDLDAKLKAESRETDAELKEKQLKDERTDRIIKNVLTLVTLGTTVGLTVWGTVNTFKFEETGTVTSLVGRGFINKLLPKK